MTAAQSLDQRYIEFRDKTKAVFARFPQMEPLRHPLFRECVIQARPPSFHELVKHWVRPLLRSKRTTTDLEAVDILLWVEGDRSIMRDTILPLYQELRRRAEKVQLVSYGGSPDLPDRTVYFQYPAGARAPRWAGPAWEALCDAEPQVDRACARRSFLYASANLSALSAEMDRVLAAMRPSVVVAASSQMLGGSELFASAGRRGVRTVLLQHGTVQPFYTPLAADAMVTWGRSSSATLERLGIESHRLLALGSPRHDSMAAARNGTARQALLQELSLKEARTLVFFSNGNDLLRNGIAPGECARWLNGIAERFKEDLHVIVRLHPNEDGSLYRDYRRLIMTKHSPSFERLMGGCDCVSSLCSTAMYEALLYGRPVWQFHADEWPDLADNWAEGFATRVSSEIELADLVSRLLKTDRTERQNGHLVQDVFTNHGRAAAAIADYITSEVRRVDSPLLTTSVDRPRRRADSPPAAWPSNPAL